MTEAEEFQTRLLQKIEEWKNTADFKAGSSNRQKLERSASLVAGTQPEVLVKLFGPNPTIPDEERMAMQMVRNMDERTLKALQIFTLPGKDRKLVGHHELPANILGKHIRHMPVEYRMEIFRNLYDRGIKSGMDPEQIRLLPAMVHFAIAHGGDFQGRKTGALLPVIAGEKPDAFLKRFDSALDVTFRMAKEAAEAPLTQAWNAGMRGALQGLGIEPDIPLGAPETPMEFRALATRALTPIAEKVETAVLQNIDDPAKIQATVAELTKTEGAIKPQLVEQLQQQAPSARQAVFNFGGSTATLDFVETTVPNQPIFPNRLIRGAKALTKAIPSKYDDVLIAPAVAGFVGTGALLGGASPAEAGQVFTETTSDILLSDVKDVQQAITTKTDNKLEQDSLYAKGLAGATGLAATVAPPLGVASLIFTGAGVYTDIKIQEKKEREKDMEVYLRLLEERERGIPFSAPDGELSSPQQREIEAREEWKQREEERSADDPAKLSMGIL
tara:strand:- start:61 stop:1563 length:1503 start_codon:yes stop_codon:yes gene_type:complete